MRHLTLLAALLLPLAAHAQPAPPSASANLAGQLAQNLSAAMTENDALRAQNTALQAEVTSLKAAAKPAIPRDPPATVAPAPNATLPAPKAP
jgi:hypothetical protein